MSARGIFRFAQEITFCELKECRPSHFDRIFGAASTQALPEKISWSSLCCSSEFFSFWIACIPGTKVDWGQLWIAKYFPQFSWWERTRYRYMFYRRKSKNHGQHTIWLEWVCGNTFLGALQIFQWEIDDALCVYVDFFYAMHMNDIASKLPGKYELFERRKLLQSFLISVRWVNYARKQETILPRLSQEQDWLVCILTQWQNRYSRLLAQLHLCRPS